MEHGDRSQFQVKELIPSPPWNDQNYGLRNSPLSMIAESRFLGILNKNHSTNFEIAIMHISWDQDKSSNKKEVENLP